MNKRGLMSRRTALKAGVAGAAAGALPLVHMRTAYAAGKLRLGFWDHWVPSANPAMRKLVAEWATKNHVDVKLDFLTGGVTNNQQALTESSEALSGTGHDVLAFVGWDAQKYRRKLEPVDDVMTGLIKQYGKIDPTVEHIGTADGHWIALPTSVGTRYTVPSCGRISWFKKWGYDVRKWYPDKPGSAKSAEPWTYDLMLTLARKAKEAGKPFALGLGLTSDSVAWTAQVMHSFGAELVDSQGKIQVRTDAMQEALEYFQRLYPYLPADTSVFNDASNNKALIADSTPFIFNATSAWWVARRSAPKVAEDCWTFPTPKGPNGRYEAYLPMYWGIWSFSPNKSAAKELITWLQQRSQVETLCDASGGYDNPPFISMQDFTIWSTEKPPVGTIYNYQVRPWHDVTTSLAGSPAPPHIAAQIYDGAPFTVMIVKLAKNKEPMKDVLDWAEQELNGYITM